MQNIFFRCDVVFLDVGGRRWKCVCRKTFDGRVSQFNAPLAEHVVDSVQFEHGSHLGQEVRLVAAVASLVPVSASEALSC